MEFKGFHGNNSLFFLIDITFGLSEGKNILNACFYVFGWIIPCFKGKA